MRKIAVNSKRLYISFAAIIIPILLLSRGIYGSFIFTFSIPILWQIGLFGKSVESLGIRVGSIKSTLFAGVASGCLLGYLGGTLLKSLGITGYIYNNTDNLQFSIGVFNIFFPLQKEIGYRLLSISNSPVGVCAYLIFCIFVIGLGEEIFWRGFIQKKISGYLPANMSIWVTAFLFSMIHFYIFTILPIKTGISFLVLIAFAGGMWGYLFKYFGNIWSAAISHGITTFVIWKYYFFASS